MRLRTKVGIAVAAVLVLGVAVGGATIYGVSQNPAAPKVDAQKIRVAAVGDSNTYGYGVVLDNRTKNSYPAQLQSLLGTKYEVLNYGLTGRTLLSDGDRPYTAEPFFNLSQQVEPGVVLIMLGTNDAKPQNWNAAEYEQQLATLATIYRNLASHPAVYLLTPPAAFTNTARINPQVVADQVVPIVKRVGKKLGLPVVDIYSVTKTHADLFSDGIHPNAVGYKLIADAVYAKLSQRSK
jgi:acyl-CoA thioesterase-1